MLASEAGALTVRDPLDLAVVGGGVAGCYVAYRIGRARPDWAVGLFEGSERIGGRLLSLRPPETSDVRAELGGMRFRTSQPLICGIIDELALETRPFGTAHPDNRFFLRGAHLRAPDFADPSLVPYRLGVRHQARSPERLLLDAFETIVPRATALTDEEWGVIQRTHRFEGEYLYEWGLRDLLLTVLGAEAYQFVVDGFGYHSDFGDRNAADALPWFLVDARAESENRTLVDGMDRLPRELASRFERSGGRTHRRHRLLAVQREPDGAGAAFYRLAFEGGASVRTRRLVLAMPVRSIEALGARTPFLGRADVESLTSSVTPHGAVKLYLGYERAWWRDRGVLGLRSVSDLQLRKTYFLDRQDLGAASEPSLLLASFSDGPSGEFWLSKTDRVTTLDDERGSDPKMLWDRSTFGALVDAAQRQLMALHDLQRIPDPVSAAFMDWGRAPFGGAWHWWNTGAKSWEVIPRIVQPVSEWDVYICGEAYSASQGWVEGALETADMVVRRIVGQ